MKKNMKKVAILVMLFGVSSFAFSQHENPTLKMVSEYASDNKEIRDILRFEGIDYYKLKFTGEELRDKGYHITVKEIWDGKIVRDTTVFNSKTIGIKELETVNDSVLSFNVISKLTPENKLKMSFVFPRFGVTKEYDAIQSTDYSLRNVADESKLAIGYGKKFYLLTYILPYEMENGFKSWCAVGSSGDDIENWGARFGIKHYLVFEMEFS